MCRMLFSRTPRTQQSFDGEKRIEITVENVRAGTRRLTMLAMLLAIMMALSAVEHMLPALPMLPPNLRLGLANIVSMYTLFFLGKRPAFLLAFLKSAFVLLTRGVIAGALSLCGGFLSLLVIIVMDLISKKRFSMLILSISGAIAHNLGQLNMASVLLGTNMVFGYFPVLIISGIVMGSITGTLLRVVMPLFHRIVPNKTTGDNS